MRLISSKTLFTQSEIDKATKEIRKQQKRNAEIMWSDEPKNGDLVCLYDPDAGGGMTASEVSDYADIFSSKTR